MSNSRTTRVVRKTKLVLALALAATGCLVGVAANGGVSAHDVPGYRTMEFARHLVKPTAMAFAPDGRLLVAEKEGTVAVIAADGGTLEQRALSLPVDTYRERGMLSITFDPAFDANGFLYLFYSKATPSCHHVVSRFTMTGDIIDPTSELQLINVGDCGFGGGHNAGGMHIANDGTLMVQTGEQNYSEFSNRLDSLFGKVLRINLDGTIPTDNPFIDQTTGKFGAIFARGLRNPFSGDIDPVTGDLFVNDVGHHAFEEVNHVVAGADYGWPDTEGPFDPNEKPKFASYSQPFHSYPHGPGEFEGCAIVGGAFYRSDVGNFPAEFQGDWLFADYCGGYIHRLDRATGDVTEVVADATLVADIEIGPDGNIYYVDRDGGPLGSFVRRVEYSLLPGLAKQPTSISAPPGDTALFRVLPSGNPDWTYQWYRDGVPIDGATNRVHEFTAVSADDGAEFHIEVTNAAGTITSTAASLTVIGEANAAPSVTIDTPINGQQYRGSQTIEFSASATDPEDGVLADDAFSWELVFHHAEHTHPFIEEVLGASGSFVVPIDDETATDVFYRLHVTVTDSGGAESTTFHDIVPKVVNLRLLSEPPGLPLTLDGQPVDTTFRTTSVTGAKRALGAPETANIDGVDWEFDTWFDSSRRERRTVTQAGTRSYFANYRIAGGHVGSGIGLHATYFDNDDFTNPQKTRRDRVVRFAWRNSRPTSAIEPSTFSARWTGDLIGQFSEDYTISVAVRGHVKVTIDGEVVIDASRDFQSFVTGTIDLVAGQRYPIEVEYSNPGTVGIVKLYWGSASTPRSLIPSSQLAPISIG